MIVDVIYLTETIMLKLHLVHVDSFSFKMSI